MNVRSGHQYRQDDPPGSLEVTIDDLDIPDQSWPDEFIEPTITIKNLSLNGVHFDITWYINGQPAGQEIIDGDSWTHPGVETHSYTMEIGPVPEGDTEVCVEVANIRNANGERLHDPRYDCDVVRDPSTGTPLGLGIPTNEILLMGGALGGAYVIWRRKNGQ